MRLNKNFIVRTILESSKIRPINYILVRVIKIDNNIYVIVREKNKIFLEYPKFNIKTLAYIGKNGITTDKKEGDGKTPVGEFKLGIILSMYEQINNKNGKKTLKINKDMYWVDDYESKYYNMLVDVGKIRKDFNSAEHLIDFPIQYEYLIEINANPNNIPKKGSAIFLHCANNKPTLGCIAVDRNIMKKIVENIDKYTLIKIFPK